MLELSDFLDRKPANLSGGQRQRVAMGRAMVRDAHAFLFDEPLSNLDAKLRAQMRTEISRLQNELGSTTVYVTHDQVEAMTLGDRLALLRKGALQQVGTPRELYERPVNLFVAGFIGSPPMNFLPAERRRRRSLRTPFGDVPFDTARLAGEVDDEDDLIVVGIRPEQFHDPARLDDDERRGSVTFRARVDVIEWLGDEQLLYVPYEAPERVQQQLAELATRARRGDSRARSWSPSSARRRRSPRARRSSSHSTPRTCTSSIPPPGPGWTHEPLPRAA